MIMANQHKSASPKYNISHHYCCSCGFSTDVSSNFKKHLIEEHQGKAPQDSSHFIAHLTEILLPNPMIKHFKNQFIPFDDSQDQMTQIQTRIDGELIKQAKSIIIQQMNEKVNQKPEEIKIKRGPGRPKRKPIHIQKTEQTFQQHIEDDKKLEKIRKRRSSNGRGNISSIIAQNQSYNPQKKQQKILEEDKKIELFQQQLNQPEIKWNGFKLIKNRKIKTKDYCCGQCNFTFIDIQHFIIHCIQECQELKHPNSSHFIKSSQEDQSISEDMYFPQELQMITQKTNERKTRKRKNPIIDDSFEQNKVQVPIKDPIYALFGKEQIKQKLFTCSCNQKFTSKTIYMQHIIRTIIHSQMITSKQSHIILRAFTNENRLRLRRICIKILFNEDTQRVYYCPCNVEFKMNMKELIKHILQVHKGISPIYQYLSNKIKNQITSSLL